MTAELRKKKHFPIIRDIAVPALTLLLVSWVGVKFRESADVDGMWNDPIFDKLLIVAFTIATAFLLFRLTAIFILDGLLVLSVKRPIPKILKDVVGIFFGFVALLICIGVLFSEAFSSFLALSGILGVVIGLALRPIILDIFSGVSTNMEAAFLIGDWITVKNENVTYTGWVDQINWRTTHIRTRAGNLVVCPNSFLSTSIVTNHSRPYKLSRYEIHLKLPPELPTDRAVTILRNAVQATLNVPGGPSSGKTPDILITELGDSGINYWIRFWVDPSENSYDTAIHKVSESVMRHLRTAGIRLAAERRHVLHEGAPRFAADYHQIEDRLDLLEGLALFGGMQRESLRDLANSMELRRFRAGEDYFHEGDNSTQMFILLEGSLLVTLEKGDQHIELTSLQPGDYFGEMALLTGEPRSATVRSYTDSLSFEISRDAMKQLVEDHAEVLKLMSRNLAARKLANDASIRTALAEEENSNDSLASILFTKMKELFSLTNRPWGSRPSIPKTGVEGGQE